MRKEHRFNLTALLIGFALLMLLQVYTQYEHIVQMPYSDFKKGLPSQQCHGSGSSAQQW